MRLKLIIIDAIVEQGNLRFYFCSIFQFELVTDTSVTSYFRQKKYIQIHPNKEGNVTKVKQEPTLMSMPMSVCLKVACLDLLKEHSVENQQDGTALLSTKAITKKTKLKFTLLQIM